MYNPQKRAEWSAALRSGKYQQGHEGCMIYMGLHCCLGVKMALEGATEVSKTVLLMPDGSVTKNATAYLPPEFSEELGLTEDQQRRLALRNDGCAQYRKHSFSEIADIIDTLPVPSAPMLAVAVA